VLFSGNDDRAVDADVESASVPVIQRLRWRVMCGVNQPILSQARDALALFTERYFDAVCLFVHFFLHCKISK